MKKMSIQSPRWKPESNTGVKRALTYTTERKFNKRLLSCAEVLGVEKPRSLIVTSPAVTLNPKHVRKGSSFCSLAGRAWEKIRSLDDAIMNDGEMETLKSQFFELEGPEDLTKSWIVKNEEIFAASFARRAVDLLKWRLSQAGPDVLKSQVKWNNLTRKARGKYLRTISQDARNELKLSDRFYRNAVNDGENINLQEFEFMMKEWCIKFESSQNLKEFFNIISRKGNDCITMDDFRAFLGSRAVSPERLVRKLSRGNDREKDEQRFNTMRRRKWDELRSGAVDTERAMRSMVKYCAIKSRERGRYLFQQQLKNYQQAAGVFLVPFSDQEGEEAERIAEARRSFRPSESDAHPLDVDNTAASRHRKHSQPVSVMRL